MVISLRRLKRPVLAALILFLLGTVVFKIYQSSFESKGQQISDQIDEANVEAFLSTIACFIKEGGNIEIFDIAKGEVVKSLELSPETQNIVEKYLDNISGMYVKVKAFPEKGQIMRIPLEPEVEVVNKWLNSYGIFSVGEVFIIFPEDDVPYLLVLDSNNRPLFFNFKADDKLELIDKLGSEIY